MDNQDVKMNELQEMMKLLANALSNMKGELLLRMDKLDKKIDGVEKSLSNKIDNIEERLIKRIDKIGLQIANLEDDTPTREEFDNLEVKVKKIENVMLNA